MTFEIKPTKVIHKYPFSMKTPKFGIRMPKDFKFLSVQFQDDVPSIWVECCEVSVREEFNFQIFGTGQDIPMSATYLTTFTFGPWVSHLYRLS
jgi:hypothetical protein